MSSDFLYRVSYIFCRLRAAAQPMTASSLAAELECKCQTVEGDLATMRDEFKVASCVGRAWTIKRGAKLTWMRDTTERKAKR